MSTRPLMRLVQRRAGEPESVHQNASPTVGRINSERMHSAVMDAYRNGLAVGERTGYVSGVRGGAVAGLCWGLLCSAAGLALALRLGWLVLG